MPKDGLHLPGTLPFDDDDEPTTLFAEGDAALRRRPHAPEPHEPVDLLPLGSWQEQFAAQCRRQHQGTVQQLSAILDRALANQTLSIERLLIRHLRLPSTEQSQLCPANTPTERGAVRSQVEDAGWAQPRRHTEDLPQAVTMLEDDGVASEEKTDGFDILSIVPNGPSEVGVAKLKPLWLGTQSAPTAMEMTIHEDDLHQPFLDGPLAIPKTSEDVQEVKKGVRLSVQPEILSRQVRGSASKGAGVRGSALKQRGSAPKPQVSALKKTSLRDEHTAHAEQEEGVPTEAACEMRTTVISEDAEEVSECPSTVHEESSSEDELDVQHQRFSQREARMRAKSMAVGHKAADEIMRLASMQDQDDVSWMRRFIGSMRFEACSAILLGTNIAFLGIQVEYKLQTLSPSTPMLFQIINSFYCVAFTVELALRMWCNGCRKFFFSNDGLWNCFDIVVVSLQLVETSILVVTTAMHDQNVVAWDASSVGLRMIKVARIVRIVRVIRVMRFLRAFKVLIAAIYGTLKSCAWAVLLLCFIMYVFGVIFAQSAADHLINLQGDDRLLDEAGSTLHQYYGTLPRSIFTLFKAINGGVDWQDVVIPLAEVGWSLVAFFVLYVSFVQLVVMNVMAGFFLQSAIEQAQQDQEHIIQLRLSEKQLFVERLQDLFKELDSSQDGSIQLNEFEAHLKDEHMQAFLQTFEIENADAWTLFKLLDTDGGGSVDYSEFVDGCIRLKGNAKSIQMAQLMYHHKWIMDKVCDLSDFVHTALRPVVDALDVDRQNERESWSRRSDLTG